MKAIINADDFGPNRDVNERIFQTFEQGLISSASALSNFEWPTGTVNRVHTSGLPLGVHLNYTIGKPVSSPNRIRTLLDKEGGDSFCSNKSTTVDPQHLELEFTAQIERFRSLGLEPTHLDNHRPEIYFEPSLFKVVIKLAQRYRLPVRNPVYYLYDNLISTVFKLSGTTQDVLDKLRLTYQGLLESHRVKSPECFVPDIFSHQDEFQIAQILSEIPENLIVEMCVHLNDGLGYNLIKQRLGAVIEKRKIELIDFRFLKYGF